jgi:hypothetical protein
MIDSIAQKDIIQDFKPNEEVIYHHSNRTKVKCKFIEYMDYGFSAHIEALDGKKKGLIFLALMNKITRS